MNEYIDVRGPWPIYFCGPLYVRLPGKPRDISIGDARIVARALGEPVPSAPLSASRPDVRP